MSVTYNAKILLKTGYGYPGTVLDTGEAGYDLSTNKLWVGNGIGNAPEGIIMDPSFNNLAEIVAGLEASTGNYTTYSYVDGSLNNIRAVYIPDVSFGTSSFYFDASGYLQTATADTFTAGKNIDIDASFNINVVDQVKDIWSLEFNSNLTLGDVSRGEGIIHWNETVEGLVVGTQFEGVEFGLIRDNAFYAIAAVDIPKGRAVSIIDASGGLPRVGLTDGTSKFASVIGISVTDISAGEQGYIQFSGKVQNLDMSAFGEGDYLRLDTSTNGTFSDSTPVAPNPITFIGIVTNSDVSEGSLLLTIDNGPRLSYLPDVNSRFTTANNDILIYDSSNKYWNNKNFNTALSDASVALSSYNVIQDASIHTLETSVAYLFQLPAQNKLYIDGSLAARDVSIAWLNANKANLTDLYPFATNASVGLALQPYATIVYVDGSLAQRDASIAQALILADIAVATKTSYAYVDGSLAKRDTSIAWLNTNKTEGTGDIDQITVWSGSKTLIGAADFVRNTSQGHVAIGQTTPDEDATFTVNTGVATHNTVSRFFGDIDGFAQIEIRNESNGPSASADVIASNDIGTDDENYIDMGINSTTYGAPDSLPGDGYLYLSTDASTAAAGNLLIGNTTYGKDLILFTGEGLDPYTQEQLRITFDGSVLIGQPVSQQYKLEVNGDINIPTGSNYLKNGVPLSQIYTTYAYVDGSIAALNASIGAAGFAKDASFALFVPYTGATNNLALGDHDISSIDGIQFNLDPSRGFSQGRMFYDKNYDTIAVNLDGDVTLQMGQENFVYVKNNTASLIPNGKAVYMTGSFSGYPTIDLALADNENTSKVLGVTTMDIPADGLGFITNLGVVHDINTLAFSTGDRLYLSDVSAGELNNTPGLVWSFVGTVLEDSATTGSVLINPQALTSLTGLTDVIISNPTNSQVLTWNGLHWINSNTATTSAGAGVAYFLSSVASDISTYELMARAPAAEGETIEVRTLNSGSGEVLIDAYASPSTGLQVVNLDGGVWHLIHTLLYLLS